MIISKKAQLKIQEMAFVLIGIIIFFALVVLVYMVIRMSSLREDVTAQRAQEAKNLVDRLADLPEFSWAGCGVSGCLDADKAVIIKEKGIYKQLWDLDFLRVEIIYPPKPKAECTSSNFPNCNTITIINRTAFFGTPTSTYTAVCRYDSAVNTEKCEMGLIYASGRAIQ